MSETNYRSQFLKLENSEGKTVFINVDSIALIERHENHTHIRMMGQEYGCLVKESMEDIENLLPSSISIKEMPK